MSVAASAASAAADAGGACRTSHSDIQQREPRAGPLGVDSALVGPSRSAIAREEPTIQMERFIDAKDGPPETNRDDTADSYEATEGEAMDSAAADSMNEQPAGHSTLEETPQNRQRRGEDGDARTRLPTEASLLVERHQKHQRSVVPFHTADGDRVSKIAGGNMDVGSDNVSTVEPLSSPVQKVGQTVEAAEWEKERNIDEPQVEAWDHSDETLRTPPVSSPTAPPPSFNTCPSPVGGGDGALSTPPPATVMSQITPMEDEEVASLLSSGGGEEQRKPGDSNVIENETGSAYSRPDCIPEPTLSTDQAVVPASVGHADAPGNRRTAVEALADTVDTSPDTNDSNHNNFVPMERSLVAYCEVGAEFCRS